MRFVNVGLGVIAAVGLAGAYACGGAAPPPPNPPPPVVGSASAAASASGAPVAPSSGSGGTILIKDLHAPNALAVDKASIYWVNELDGDLSRVPKRGGTQMSVFAGNGTAFEANSSIAVDDTDVYWTSQAGKLSSFSRQDKNGGKPTVVASSTFAPIECVAIDDTNMYWLLGGGVVKAGKSGGAPQALAGGFKGANCVAVDDAHVYWSVGGTEGAKFTDG